MERNNNLFTLMCPKLIYYLHIMMNFYDIFLFLEKSEKFIDIL
jgi:hypothetical protein